MRVAKPVQGAKDLAEYGLEFAAAAVVGVDRSDDGVLVFLDEAGERLEVREPLGVAGLRRREESRALCVEARLQLGWDGEAGNGNFGRVHLSPFLLSDRRPPANRFTQLVSM